ncbi:MAG: hypothetical protein JWM80_3081 [Cyanobacteria bacterium RYN_339]|nr:hypothetical protein [Cyanobacteria bacterium RYN_339]
MGYNERMMFKRSVLLAAVLLTACQVADPTTRAKVKTTASATPAASAAKPSPTPPPAASLQRPPGTSRALAGQVAIDARYVLDAKAGQILSNNSGSVIAVGEGAAALPAGSNLISNNGGSVISDNGGSVISDNGGSYRLAATADTLFGAIAPAAGMSLRVLDLQTNASLQLGVDPAGKPVYEVLSDAAGKFTVYLPADVGASVLLTAAAPGTTDRRLRYTHLASAASIAVDEDTAQASETIRLGYGSGMLGIFKPHEKAEDLLPYEEAANRPAIIAGYARLRAALAAVHAEAWDDKKKHEVAQRFADLIIARYTDATTRIDRAHGFTPYTGPDESTFEAYAGLLRAEREGVTRKMQDLAASGQDPLAYFNQRPYITRARTVRGVAYEIKKPADWVYVINGIYLDSSKENLTQTFTYGAEAFGDIGLDFATFGRYLAALRGDSIAANRILYLEPANGALEEGLKLIAGS